MMLGPFLTTSRFTKGVFLRFLIYHCLSCSASFMDGSTKPASKAQRACSTYQFASWAAPGIVRRFTECPLEFSKNKPDYARFYTGGIYNIRLRLCRILILFRKIPNTPTQMACSWRRRRDFSPKSLNVCNIIILQNFFSIP